MHALEILAEVAPTTPPRAVELCDWLAAISLADGGLPFALPRADRAGNAPLWVEPDTPVSSLQTTTQVAANAHLVGRHHADVAGHGWLSRATQWCLTAIDSLDTAPHAYELLFAIRFLDAVDEVEPATARLLDRLSQYLPADGVVAVQGAQKARRSDRSTSRSGPTARQGGCSPRQ